MKRNKKIKEIAPALALCLIAACLLGLSLGSLRLGGLFQDMENRELALMVLFRLRLPRVVFAAAAGACLGVSGAGFQAVFRNALADPFIIGASSGAALGAGVAMIFPVSGALSASAALSVPAASFAGSLASVFAALLISRAAGIASATNLLLAGSAVSALCSSMLSLLFILKDGGFQRVYYWMLGSLAVSWNAVLSALPLMFAGTLAIFLSSRAMDLLLQGDETAGSLGLDVKKARITVILGASLAVAATVSVCGVVGFVGLVAPHVARLFTGSIHKRLLPASALFGALIVLIADIASRSVLPPLEIPIGIITALGGSPFFLFLLAKNSGAARGR
ncbi:MAG: iron ABC transporter permease [Treponema sp.]|jgi:iron complex transport system permease protein|nr:iron ABC transporter permease [Treponema sp.]